MIRTHFISKRAIFCAFFALLLSNLAFGQQAQKLRAPREEKLLNGLKLLIWNDPQASKSTIKVRIHSGAAFDPKDKMGVMALLGDMLFPTDEAKAFFTEDLEGSYDLKVNHDYIELSVTGKNEEFLSMIQAVASAFSSPQITPENFEKVKKARIARVAELEKDPEYVARLAAAQRLFGEFPYGRSSEGASKSLALIDRADILFAKQRLLTSDNATVAVIGNVKPDFVYRASRQLFGSWTMADKKVPATFRVADPPVAETLKVEFAGLENSVSAWAVSAPSRKDKDYYAAIGYFGLLNGLGTGHSFQYGGKLLKGMLTGGNAGGPCSLSDSVATSTKCPRATEQQFGLIKNALAKSSGNFYTDLSALASLWLDVDTYKLISAQAEIDAINNLTLNDVNRIGELLEKQPVASVILVKPASTAQN